MSSIDNEFERETAEGPAEHTLAEGSVGSETETAKPLVSDDAGKYTNEVSHHVRSNSIKKPTTFKAVSVTKNFLAKAGTVANPNAKVNGDKGIQGCAPADDHANEFSYVYHDDNNSALDPQAKASRKVCEWPAGLCAQNIKYRIQKWWGRARSYASLEQE